MKLTHVWLVIGFNLSLLGIFLALDAVSTPVRAAGLPLAVRATVAADASRVPPASTLQHLPQVGEQRDPSTLSVTYANLAEALEHLIPGSSSIDGTTTGAVVRGGHVLWFSRDLFATRETAIMGLDGGAACREESANLRLANRMDAASPTLKALDVGGVSSC